MQRSNKEDGDPLLRWEWRLPGGESAAATLDPTTRTESVFLDGLLVSRAARGTKPEGHVVTMHPAPDEAPVVVTFDPQLVICVLRIGREEVTPAQWPKPRRDRVLDPPNRPFPLGVIAAVLLAALVGGGVVLAMHLRASSNDADATIAGVHRADNGLFVAHFPASFAARLAVVPIGMSGLVLEDRKSTGAIVIVALVGAQDGVRDPWALQKRVHGEALANLPRGGGAHVETARSDGICLGQPGAVVLGRVVSTRGTPASMWSCAFFRGGDGYIVMYMLGETASAEDAARLRSVIDATELTRLENISRSAP